MKPRACPLALAFVVALPLSSQAQWIQNGTLACIAPGEQYSVKIASDGAGGSIVSWVDNRGADENIYAQRIAKNGSVMWATNGVGVCTASGPQFTATMTPDGAGGVIIAWADFRTSLSFDIYMQRIDASGAVLWTNNGVEVSILVSDQTLPVIVGDGSGGAIVAWTDHRSGNLDVYARRVNAAGVAQWTLNGNAICTNVSNQQSPRIVSDGAGGAIIAWQDFRNGNADIYAQRVNGSGVVQWAANGLPVCTQADQQSVPSVTADGAGGAILAWSQIGTIFAQRLGPTGSPAWTVNGVLVCDEYGLQEEPVLVSDGTGGAVIAWFDGRNQAEGDIFAQRVSALGLPVWTDDGIAVCTSSGAQDGVTITTDGQGGAIVAWTDQRSGNLDIYAQRVVATGTVFWSTNGVQVCTAPSTQSDLEIASDGAGVAAMTWIDDRAGAGADDIYVQRVDGRYGTWGHPEPVLDSANDTPADQGGQVRVNWYASGRDRLNQQFISHYSIWRAIDAAAVAALKLAGTPMLTLTDINESFSGPAIRHEATATADYFWELIANKDAIYLDAYSYAAATAYDSTAQGAAEHQFQVVSHAFQNQYMNWPSNVVSGYSVDNLAPAAPLLLTAQRVGPDVLLDWNQVEIPDLRDYSVYRANASGVTPVPINFLASADDTVLVDASAPTTGLYYIVTAYDVHDNESAPSNEASVEALTGVGDTPALTSLSVLQNRPNPFAGSTELQIGLPAPSDISVEIYDVAGRRVRTIEVKGADAGWRSVPFSGRDEAGRSLASGVYFYRVRAGNDTITRKMVITR